MSWLKNLRKSGQRQDIEAQAQAQAKKQEKWEPPTEHNLSAVGEIRRQRDLMQAGQYAHPQQVSGWLWASEVNRLMRGAYESEGLGNLGPVHHDPRRSSASAYQVFKDYDLISKELRDLAPDDKPVGDEDEAKFKSAGIEFGQLIGGGAFGKVWHATVTLPDGTQHPCVVKRLAFADFKDKKKTPDKAISYILAEIKACKRMMGAVEEEERFAGRPPSYPPVLDKNVIGCDKVWRIYQSQSQFPDPISILLFLEACDTDLKHVIEPTRGSQFNVKFTEDDARKLFVQIGNALKWLHMIGIVHFDIKPDNIMVKFDPADPTRGQFKLGDFGMATVYNDPNKMRAIGFRGTRMYAAPELYKPLAVHSKLCDVYSLGSTTVMAITGFGPYRMLPTGLKKQYTDHNRCMTRFEAGITQQLNPRDQLVLDLLGFKNLEIIDFFRQVCSSDLLTRPDIDWALTLPWIQHWQYQSGFVELSCLPASQQQQLQPGP